MKRANRAPFFACIYHGLAETARKHGYALAIHGTLNADLDLVAIPWVDEAVEATVLIQVLMENISSFGYEASLQRDGWDQKTIDQIMQSSGKDADTITKKPHGRIAVNLYMGFGAKVDLSIMPRIIN